MKKILLPLLLLAGCSAQRWIPDHQEQVTLIGAYKEFKSNACGLPRNPDIMGRTWHIDLLRQNGDTIYHHYFTASHVNQRWLVVGDKYSYRYDSRDSIECEKHPFIFAKLKWNK